ncbi:LacI family DNA-binding transcriptional regulator [Luethyella okanaganae]|uniref:LacI family DNA-binding transcriptional regulator n=1 Tax=Luethyella okanaganae TaxID=69372 RepID=A0ABW1VAQ4_9MICO
MSLGMDRPRPTIYDVAHRAGVSKSLVSLVLQGSSRVSEHRRAAVQEAIDALGYRPSRAAAALAGNRTKSIGIVIDDFRNLWFVDLLEGVREVLRGPGFHVTVADAQLNSHLERSPADGFLAANVEGLVIAGEPSLAAGAGYPVPTVVVGGRERGIPGADVVANDDEAGAALAVGHLLDLGHTRIGHLTGSGGAASLRAASFERTIRDAGLEPRISGHGQRTTEGGGYAGACELFERFPDTTAVFAANDIMAIGALAAIRERGLSVPRDVSVIGYDDSPLASARYLSLTSIDDGSVDVGREAARLLLARIEDGTREPERSLIEPRLALRDSTSRPSTDGRSS